MHAPFPSAALALTVFFLPAQIVSADITPESRDSSVDITTTNFGVAPGYDGGDDFLFGWASGLVDSSADLVLAQTLFYGPDSFGRINSGDFSVSQDAEFDTSEVSLELEQNATVAGDANPLIDIRNEATVYFSVPADTEATFTVEYTGETNVGDDQVACRLRRVGPGSDPVVLETLFNLGAFPDGNDDTITETVSLLAGERYRIFASGRARAIVSGSTASKVSVSIETVGCPADLVEPFGELNFFDIAAYIALYNAGDPGADLAEPFGSLNFFDISAYISLYNAGCP